MCIFNFKDTDGVRTSFLAGLLTADWACADLLLVLCVCRQEHLGSDLQSSPSQEAKHPHSPGFVSGTACMSVGDEAGLLPAESILCQSTLAA